MFLLKVGIWLTLRWDTSTPGMVGIYHYPHHPSPPVKAYRPLMSEAEIYTSYRPYQLKLVARKSATLGGCGGATSAWRHPLILRNHGFSW